MKLIVFDLDQTLVQIIPLHNKASEMTLKRTFGVKARMEEIDYVGKTLKKALNEMAMLKGVKKNERDRKIPRAVKLYIKNFVKLLPRNTKKFYLPGAVNLVKKLSRDRDNFLIILSGDAERIVTTILKRANLLNCFHFIIAGEHKISRINLMRSALKKTHRQSKVKRFDDIVVIGDSIHDIAAGKAVKAVTIAITTGTHSKKQLRKAGADYIFRNLKNKKILEIIG